MEIDGICTRDGGVCGIRRCVVWSNMNDVQ